MKAKINKEGDLVLTAENDAEYAIINGGDYDVYLDGGASCTADVELPKSSGVSEYYPRLVTCASGDVYCVLGEADDSSDHVEAIHVGPTSRVVDHSEVFILDEDDLADYHGSYYKLMENEDSSSIVVKLCVFSGPKLGCGVSISSPIHETGTFINFTIDDFKDIVE